MHCRFDEFEEDTSLNRIIKSALRVVACSAVLPLSLRKRAIRGLSRLDHIGVVQREDLTARVERRSSHYAPRSPWLGTFSWESAEALRVARHKGGVS